ncbi:MAG: aminotransferase class IV [Alphaproteobacteria bacterium]
MICWLNGVLGPIEDARIDPGDRGFLLGDGIFETLLAVDGAVRHGPKHLARLSGASGILGLSVPYPKIEIMAAMLQLLHVNQLRLGRSALRLTLTRGAGARGVAPPAQAACTILLTAVSLPPPPLYMRAIVSSCIRSENSISSRIKSLNYLDNIMARKEAAQRGVDEAVMRNSAGNIASASSANIFVVADGALYTPAIGDGALPGIMRAIVLEAAAGLKIPADEGPLTPDGLKSASEIFLTNALIGVCPLIELDGAPVGTGAMGPVTGKLRLSTNPG